MSNLERELLEALENALRFLERLELVPEPSYSRTRRAVAAAIQKAKGGV